jgi:hypothetical protein
LRQGKELDIVKFLILIIFKAMIVTCMIDILMISSPLSIRSIIPT